MSGGVSGRDDDVGRTRVMVVDDHRTFTDLMVLALGDIADLECVGAAHDSSSALALAALFRPDVALVDVELGQEDGLALAAQLRVARPALRIVVLTAHGDDLNVARRAVAVGACALVPKDGSLTELLHHLRTARAGGMVVKPHVLAALAASSAQAGPAPFAALTDREKRVLQLLASGRDVRRIAGELHLSIHTCRGYVKSLLAKLGAHSQLEAVVIANTHGLLDAAHSFAGSRRRA